MNDAISDVTTSQFLRITQTSFQWRFFSQHYAGYVWVESYLFSVLSLCNLTTVVKKCGFADAGINFLVIRVTIRTVIDCNNGALKGAAIS